MMTSNLRNFLINILKFAEIEIVTIYLVNKFIKILNKYVESA